MSNIQIPATFQRQLEAGCPVNYLNHELLGTYVRVVVERVELGDDCLLVNLRLTALTDINGNFVEQSKDASAQYNDVSWIKGYNSNTICIKKGQISDNMYSAFVQYAGAIEKFEYETGIPFREKKEGKLWLSAGSNQAMFQFVIEERKNPNTGEIVAGIRNVAWNEHVVVLNQRTESFGTVITIPMQVNSYRPAPVAPVASVTNNIEPPTSAPRLSRRVQSDYLY